MSRYKTMTINRKDVMYDVNFISWKTAKCRITEPEARSEAQTDDEGHIWFERQLATAVEHLKGRMKWCIVEHIGTATDDTIKRKSVVYGDNGYEADDQAFDSFIDDERFIEAPAEKKIPIPEHTLNFKFSSDWRGNFNTLTNYIHRYIVDYILYEWFKMTLPSESQVYLASSITWEDKVINEGRNEEVKNVFFRL